MIDGLKNSGDFKGLLDTGEPRNVIGHIVSGAVASAVVSGTINYKKAKDGEITTQEAVNDSVKKATQGAIATGTAIATANYVGQSGGFFKALTAISVGIAGIYAVEVLDDKLKQSYQPEMIEDSEEKILLAKEEDYE